MSGHSYNLDNLTRQDDGGLECPISGADHKRILESAMQLKQRGTDSEGFFRDLSHAASQNRGVYCIAEQFGRGLFTANMALQQQSSQQTTHQGVWGQHQGEQRQPASSSSAGNPFL